MWRNDVRVSGMESLCHSCEHDAGAHTSAAWIDSSRSCALFVPRSRARCFAMFACNPLIAYCRWVYSYGRKERTTERTQDTCRQTKSKVGEERLGPNDLADYPPPASTNRYSRASSSNQPAAFVGQDFTALHTSSTREEPHPAPCRVPQQDRHLR